MGLLLYENTQGKVRMFFSILIGAFLGVLLSFLINVMLIDVSFSPFFGFYFGLILGFGGIYVLIRTIMQGGFTRRLHLILFAILIEVAAVLCFLFNPKWIFDLSPAAKIPLYGVISIALSFAVTFTIVDTFNFCLLVCYPDAHGIVESQRQINVLLVASIVMGFGYGMFFGLFDIGKHAKSVHDLQHQLMYEELFCIPFGICIGAVTAGVIEYLRTTQIHAQEYKYSPLFTEEDENLI